MNLQVFQGSIASSGNLEAPSWHKPVKLALWWVLGLGSLVAIFGPAYADHISFAVKGTLINDDVGQQVFPFYKYSDSSLFRNDYIADYYRRLLPVGFHGLYWLGAKLWDPDPLSRALPYPLMLLSMVGMAGAAYRLAGGVAAWGAAALMLGSEVFMDRIVGGLPRAFAFPLLCWGVAALVAGKPKGLGLATLLSFALYPIVGVILGGTLGVWLLLFPASTRGDASSWTLRRRWEFLVLHGAVCIALSCIVIFSGRGYGSRILLDDLAEFPEAGPGGRYDKDSRPPFAPMHDATWKQWQRTLPGQGEPILEPLKDWTRKAKSSPAFLSSLTVFVVLGYALLARSSVTALRFLPFVLVSLLGYVAAVIGFPWVYMPERYTNYSVALAAVLMTAVAAVGYLEFFKARFSFHWLRKPAARHSAVLAFTLCVLVALGGRGSRTEGYAKRVNPNSPVHRAIAQLPPDSLIAGWPLGPLELVPHLSRRAALLTFETHQAFHKGYVTTMRARMTALIDAYYATDVEPLRRLRDEHGVTHLLVDFSHLEGRRHFYIKPFNPHIRRAYHQLRASKGSILHKVKQAIVFKRGKTAVFDLHRLPPK